MTGHLFHVGDRIRLRYPLFPFTAHWSGIIVRVFYASNEDILYDVLFDEAAEPRMVSGTRLIGEV